MITIQDFLGDGDGPATEGQNEETRGPLFVIARPLTMNWRVSREGELVCIEIGNAPPFRLKWKDAILFGHAIGAKGVEAKIQAGAAGQPNVR